MSRRRSLTVLFLFGAALCAAQQKTPAGLTTAIDEWKAAVATGDTGTMQNLYSADPPAHAISEDGKQQLPVADEVGFWQKTRAGGLQNLDVKVRGLQEQQGVQLVNLLLSFYANTGRGPRRRYAIEQQAWIPSGHNWKLLASTHTELLKIRPPEKLDPHLYDTAANAHTEIQEALGKATAQNKRILLVFGGNWCYDCHVLDAAMHEPDLMPIVKKNFVVVHVDIGDDGKKNADVATKYRVPIEKGVPALAVLARDGKLLYSDQHGEFERARSMDPDDIAAFLNKWKPAGK